MDFTLFGLDIELNLFTVLLTFAVLLFVLYFATRPLPGLPPFPTTPLPVVGNLHSLQKDFRPLFSQWRRDNGDLFSLYFGPKLAVVFSGYNAIKEALVKTADTFSERPDLPGFTKVFHGKGIIATSGSTWKSQRTFSLTALRNFGFGRKSMEADVLKEAKHVLEFFASYKGEKQIYSEIYNISTSNVICAMMFGQRYEYDDANFLACCRALNFLIATLDGQSLYNFFPILTRIPFAMKNTNKAIECGEYFRKHLIQAEINRHYDEYDGSTPDFVAAYIKEIKTREKSGIDATELKDNFTQTMSDLFVAGTETTATTLKWLILFLIRYPEVQEKCFQEIKDNIGLDRFPTLKDKQSLPYLEATIAETQRRSNIVPMGVMHATAEDTIFRGFNIPKGTMILLNMESVLSDPKVYAEPEKFRPERFLDKSGSFSKPESFIPFSTGRRVCLGESLAKMELFLFSAAFIQNFKFVQPSDEPTPTLEPHVGGTLIPKPYKVRAIRRNDTFPEIRCG